jgi:hypothetical protein
MARILFIAVPLVLAVAAGLFFLNRMIWAKRLSAEASVIESRDNRNQPFYQIAVETDSANAVRFESQIVSLSMGSCRVSANDLPQGSNWLYYRISRSGHERRDSVLIDNAYAPLTISVQYGYDSQGRKNQYSISTEPGTRMMMPGIDSVLATGFYEIALSPDSILRANNPDLTPTVILLYPVQLENESGNTVRDTVRAAYTFPRVSLSISDPWDGYISRTGGSYTIRGSAPAGAVVRFYDGPGTYYPSLGQVRPGQSGSFSKYVTVSDFGNNVYTLVASVEGMTSDTATVTIYREMTDSERRTAYQEECEHVTAEYLADNHSIYVGRKVRVWGRTVEWLGTNQLHCYAGEGHFIADLSGFDRVPALQGLSFTVWGEVTSRSEDFYTSAGDYVHAPVIEAVYTTTGY